LIVWQAPIYCANVLNASHDQHAIITMIASLSMMTKIVLCTDQLAHVAIGCLSVSTTSSLKQECLVCQAVAADTHIHSCIHGDNCMAVYKLEHQCGFLRFAEANPAKLHC
jgi:hypothetical protein